MSEVKDSVFHVVDRDGNRHTITAQRMVSDRESVVLVSGGHEVASFLGPVSAHRGGAVAPAAEPLLAISSTFLSSPEKSPLVEAIESTARLVFDAPQGEGREFLKAHLVKLTVEQMPRLASPVPACSLQESPRI